MNIIKFKKLCPEATAPRRQREGDAGFDIYALESVELCASGQAVISTGVACAIPAGWVGVIKPRSGLAVKYQVNVHAGVVDSNYRGEIKVCLINHGSVPVEVRKGDRVAQLLVVPCLTTSETVTELDSTERGNCGFGSSGT